MLREILGTKRRLRGERHGLELLLDEGGLGLGLRFNLGWWEKKFVMQREFDPQLRERAQRFEVCLGDAKGLIVLEDGLKLGIVH